MPPGVFRPRWQPQPGSLLLVPPPTDADFLNPMPDQLQVFLSEAELPPHRGRLQQRKHPARAKAGVRHLKETQESFYQVTLRPRGSVGDAERDSEGILLRRAE